MTQIFTGTGLGLNGSSLGQLGNYGLGGAAALGQGKVSLSVNAATGNLVIGQQDGFLAGLGLGMDLSSTYNSRGERGGHWSSSIQTRLNVNGEPNQAGSSLVRIDEDGHRSTFHYDPAKGVYLPEDGGTASLSYENNAWHYRIGSSNKSFDYDEQGRLTTITDKDNHRLECHYQDGKLTEVIDSTGKQTIKWQFESGLLREVRFESDGQLVHRLEYQYDHLNRLTKVSRGDANGPCFWVSYDYHGDSEQIASIRESDGSSMQFYYDAQGRLTRQIDGEGGETSYVYQSGKTIVTNSLGESWTYTYDEQARLTAVDGPKNWHARYTYNGQHLKNMIQGNQSWTYTYNEFGDCTRIEQSNGQVVTRRFDKDHHLLSESHYSIFDGQKSPDKIQTKRFVYDEKGHLRFAVAIDGAVTEYRYDEQGFCSSSRLYLKDRYDIDKLASEVTLTLDELTLWVSLQKNEEVSLTDYSYDWRGQLAQETHYILVDSQGNGIASQAIITRNRYDASGRLVEKSLPRDGVWATTHYFYDDLGRLIRTVDNQNHTATFEYDDAHQRVTETDARARQTLRLYDHRGLLLSVQMLDATQDYGKTQYQYDSAGRLQVEIKTDGQKKYYFYDQDGRLEAEVNQGMVRQYTYDQNGHLIKTIDYAKKLNTRDWQINMPDFASLPLENSWQNHVNQTIYNPLGEIAYQVNADGAVIGYIYDQSGRLLSKTAYATRISLQGDLAYPLTVPGNQDDRHTRYYYDKANRLIAEVNGDSYATEYRYDTQGNLLETCRFVNKVASTLTGDWSKDRPKLSGFQDRHSYHLYNKAGLKTADIEAETDGNRYLVAYSYDENGQMIKKQAYYRPLAQKIVINNDTLMETILPAQDSNDHITDYRYNDLGWLVEECSQNGLITTYDYDQGGLLTSKCLTDKATSATRKSCYRYDAMGRLTASLDGIGASLLQQAGKDADKIDKIWREHSLSYEYDQAGRLLARINALGERSQYIYDEEGKLRFTLNADGEIMEHRYDAFNQLITTIQYSERLTESLPNFNCDTLTLKCQALAKLQTDEVTHYQYNILGQVILKTKGNRHQETYLYNAFGEVIESHEQIDAQHDKVSLNQFDHRGLLTLKRDQLQGDYRQHSWEYDAFGQVIKEVDGLGGVTGYNLNHQGKCILLISACRGRKKTYYDVFGRILEETDFTASHRLKKYTYDDKHNVLTVNILGEDTSLVTHFNAFGDKLVLRDGNGQDTTYHYDENGQLLLVDSPEQHRNTYKYDAAGRLVMEKASGIEKWRFTYDAKGRVLTKILDPDGLALSTTYQYDGIGRQLQIKDANGQIKRFTYDSNGNLLQTNIDPDGLNLLTTFEYDNRGLLLRQILRNPGSIDQITAYQWDELGRCIATIRDPDGLALITRQTYDANDNLISQTNANGHTSHWAYDENNRCRYQLDPAGIVTEHRYNINGDETETIIYANKIKFSGDYSTKAITAGITINPEQDRHQFRCFDKHGKITLSFDAMGYATRYGYDKNGNVTKKTQYFQALTLEELQAGKFKPKDSVYDRTQYFAYNGLNRLIYQLDGSSLTHYIYNQAGQIIVKTAYAKSFTPGQDGFSREAIEAALYEDPEHDQSIRYGYDNADRLIIQVSANGVAFRYRYDNAGNLIETRNLSLYIDKNSLAQDNWESRLINSSQDRINRRIYDGAGREIYRVSGEGRVVARRYDAVGNAIEEINYEQTLTLAVYNAQTVTAALTRQNEKHRTLYHYDSMGRLKTKTDALNQHTDYSYDGNGNVSSKKEANGASWVYKYDEANHLIETISPPILIKSQVGGQWIEEKRSVITKNVVDGFGQIVATVRDANGMKQTRYYGFDRNGHCTQVTYPQVLIDSSAYVPSSQRQEIAKTVSEQTRYNAFGEVIAAADKAGNWRYTSYDQQGRVLYSIDSEGALTAFNYNEFGQAIQKTRFAIKLNLGGIHEMDRIRIESLINTSSYDRHETYFYNQDNQLIESRQDQVRSYDAGRGVYQQLTPITRYSYNAFGELEQKSVMRHLNAWATTHYYFDKDGLSTATVDAEGYLTSFGYDGLGNKISESQYSTKLTIWDNNHYQLPIASNQDRYVEYAYDDLGQLSKKTLKNVTCQQLTDSNHFQSITKDISITYGYDALGHLTTTQDGMGYSAFWYYDQMGQLKAKVAPPTQQGRALTTYAYDALGQLVETTQFAQGAAYADETQFTIKGHSNSDILTHNRYDENGQLLSQIDGIGHEINYSYNARGEVARSWQTLTQIDNSKQVIDKRYIYDTAGHLLQTITNKTDGQWSSQDAAYNAFGDLVGKGVNGRLTTKADYDLLGRLWRSNTDGYYQIYIYDLTDKVTQVVSSTNAYSPQYDEYGVDLSEAYYESLINFNSDIARYKFQRQSNVYDALGHLLSQNKDITQSLNSSVNPIVVNVTQSQTVDRWGNVLTHTNAKGYQTRYEYNAFDQVTRQELPETWSYDDHGVGSRINPTLKYAYDALGRVIAMTDANGHTVTKILDAQGRVIQENDAKGAYRQRGYDLLDHQISLRNEAGGLTIYTYDSANRLQSVKTPYTEQSYQYDAAGQLIRQTNGNKESLRYFYDTLGHQVIKEDARSLQTTRIFDDEGHQLSEKDANGLIQTWSYDDYGHVIEHSDLGNRKTNYRYNRNGLLLNEQSTSGKNMVYHYTGDGALYQSFDMTRLETMEYDYDELGQLTSKRSSRSGDYKDAWVAEKDYYQYDESGRLIRVRRKRPDDIDNNFPDKDTALLNIDYQYDAVGNIRHTEVMTNYTGYQPVYSNDFYKYDENNRMVINKGLLSNGEIVITSGQGSALQYDAAGNLNDARHYENGYLQHFVYRYNEDNQLLWIEKNNNRLQAKHYDASGRIDEERRYNNRNDATQVDRNYYENGLVKYQISSAIVEDFEVERAKTYYSYDNVDNLTGVSTRVNSQGNQAGFATSHSYTYEHWDSYLQSTDSAVLSVDRLPTTYGLSTRFYDVNGQLQEAQDQKTDSSGHNNSTWYLSSAIEGIRARRDKEGQTNYLKVAGKTIGDLRLESNGQQHLNVYGGFTPAGSAVAAETKTNLFNWQTDKKHSTLADFMRTGSLTQELKATPGDTADGTLPEVPQDNFGAYTLQVGDTLESVARQIYGDSSLWYLIADANGITNRNSVAGQDGQLHIGQRLNIPAAADSQHHNSSTHKVINGNQLIGNISATIPLPPIPPPPAARKKNHNLLAKMIVSVVVAVATVLAAAALGYVFAPSMAAQMGGMLKTGLAVLNGSLFTSATATVSAGFSAGFIGSMASQGLSSIMHLQHGVDLGSALIASLATAASAGIAYSMNHSAAMSSLTKSLSDYSLEQFNLNSAAEMLRQDAMNQSLNLAFNRQKNIDWARLGINGAIGGVMGGKYGEAANKNLENVDKSGILKNELNALASGALHSLAGKSTFNANQVITDHLGSAIGSSLLKMGVESETEAAKKAFLQNLEEQAQANEELPETESGESSAAQQKYQANRSGSLGYGDLQYFSGDLDEALSSRFDARKYERNQSEQYRENLTNYIEAGHWGDPYEELLDPYTQDMTWRKEQYLSSLRPEPAEDKSWHLGNRLMGGLEVVGGLSEVFAAGALTGASEGALAPLGYFLGLRGSDHIVTGLANMASGKQIKSQSVKLLDNIGLTTGHAMIADASLSAYSLAKAGGYAVTRLSRFGGSANFAGSNYSLARNSLISNRTNWIMKAQTFNYGSMIGNGVLGGISGFYGAVAAGGDKFDITLATSLSTIIGAWTHNAPNTALSGAAIAVATNLVSQAVTMVHDPSLKFNYISVGGSALGGAVFGSLTKYADPISGLIIGVMPDAAIDSVSYHLGIRRRTI